MTDIDPLPEIALELVEDLSPPDPGGFLKLVRRRYRARYPDGSVSEPFVYDAVDRRAIDAVVIAAHYVTRAERWVYLRSAVRPPLALRDPSHSPVPELDRGTGLWELPAGLVEQDEQTPEGLRVCASRELAEELGFEQPPDLMRELGPSTYPAPGIIGERHFYFEVEVDPKTRAEPRHDGSPLEHGGLVRGTRLDAALALCAKGQIEDAKTELALRRLAERFA
ncbi:MAG: NUDIX domain-containing protein [Polyangiaceae bacterium]|nr:NUDIX domain-containing protein [Polyangiaceae bacterium]MCE7894562.1 NUDIX domain-containing protein [Sorangiineae bacterium PRO1]MCL4755221.1 NUDIX domain-containing protein [Myxococcales bacterium]